MRFSFYSAVATAAFLATVEALKIKEEADNFLQVNENDLGEFA